MLHTLGSPTMAMSYGSAPNSGFFVRPTIQNATKTRERVNWKAAPWWSMRITQRFEICADCLGFGDLYSNGVLVSMCLMCLPREKLVKWKEIVGQERVEWENRLGRAHVLLVVSWTERVGAAIKDNVGELRAISWIPQIRAASPTHSHEVPCE